MVADDVPHAGHRLHAALCLARNRCAAAVRPRPAMSIRSASLYELLTGAFSKAARTTPPSERLATSTTRSTWSRRVRGHRRHHRQAVSEAPRALCQRRRTRDDLRRSSITNR